MQTMFSITSITGVVSQLSTWEDEEVLEAGITRWMEMQYLGPSKFKDIEDSSSVMVDERNRQDQTRPEKSWH